MKKKFVFYMMAAALAMSVAGCDKSGDIDDWIGGIKAELRVTEKTERPMPGQNEWFHHISVDEDLLFSMIRGIKCTPQFIDGKADDIVGRWKMMAVHEYTTGVMTDYSCENIVWHFKEDGTGFIDENVKMGVKGEFSYHFSPTIGACPLCLSGPNMRICPVKDGQKVYGDCTSMHCRVLKNTMVFWIAQGNPGEFGCRVLVRIQ